MSGMATQALVGRDHELAVLTAAVDRAFEGAGSLVLVTGEPGIGKTALVAAAADHARRLGALVLAGACWDGTGAPGYWPWVQVIRAVQRALVAEEWSAVRSASGQVIDRLLGEPSAGESDHHRSVDDAFRLSDAVASLLMRAAATRPVVIALDDLQWADDASVQLLQFVAQHAALEPVVVLATCRPSEGPDSSDLLVGLQVRATTVPLSGLDEASIAELVARMAGRSPEPDVTATIAGRTGGNPFFVEQTAQWWRSGGSLSAVPPGVREVVERRLAHLPTAAVDLLAHAALCGIEFDVDVVAAARGEASDDLRALLGHSVEAGLVAWLPDQRLRFVHDLVRETLCDAVAPADRRHAHAAIVRAVAGSATLGERVLPAQVADHAYLAGSDLSTEEAVGPIMLAARSATTRMAAAEAARHYSRVWELIDADPTTSPEAGVEIALALGVEQRRAGLLVAARTTYERLGEQARDRHDPMLFARAALGLLELGHGIDTAAAVDLIDEASDGLMSDPALAESPLAAQTVAAASRARSHHIGDDRDHAERLSARAVELARAGGDDATLGSCLLARHDAIWAPGTAGERLALADELIIVSRRIPDRELELQGSLLRFVALLEQGDPRSLDELASFAALAERSHLPRFVYLSLSRQGTLAAMRGEFDAARQVIDSARSLGDQLGEVDGLGVWADQVWQLARLQGSYDEIDALTSSLRDAGDQHVLVIEATVALDRGETGLALSRLDEVEVLGRRWPRWGGLVWLTFMAELSVASGDQELCRRTRRSLDPYLDSWAVLAGGVLVHGPMRYWAATLDAALQEWSQALAGFDQAAAAADLLGAEPWSLLARLGTVEVMLARADGDDEAGAVELLAQLSGQADELGMRRAQARIEQLSGKRRRPDGGEFASAGNVFRFDGLVWTLAFADRTTTIPDAKGLRDLHTLLSRAGTEVPATTLLNPTDTALAQAESRLGADPLLDDIAKRSYRRRLAELDDDIETALDHGDDAKAAELDRERDALIAQLTEAAGLAGRSRRLGDVTERARKTVTARIKDSLRRLDGRHPELAQHLRTSVSTGTVCRYEPESEVRWTL